MKKHLSTILLILIFIIGLSLLLYPTISDYWNSLHQSRAIAAYSEQVAQLDEDRYEALLSSAAQYNQTLLGKTNNFVLSEEQKAAYPDLLNVGGNGVMGYIEIPTIGVALPIYHGIEDEVLQIAVGHYEGSSLPVGGESTHCVVSGHRGLPSAKLFTDLDKLVVGDIFIFRVLDEVLTYEVDQILIVEPHETSALMIRNGEDLCTLITCTPYGINSHRMLVRGHRVDNLEEAKVVRITADASQIEPVIVAPLMVIPMLLILLIGMLISQSNKNRRKPK